ncbi:glycoside hydrolase family 5 protein [uncultured Acetobacteroides sp.]|uniref:glycoside hydrolase family 5 protein n=1 Tax=uncultured Acetobacteroides sp. TaxID=1760811 RepID=UPI0029F53999|nr:glycoside hydrolase family 5 protein [uncultured Acetobacteroides sp.]
MKRFVLALSFLVVFGVASAQLVKKHGALSVKGTQLVDATGNPIQLRGVSYGWHTFWPRFYNASSVKWVVNDWGATVIRAAMGVEPEDGYLKDSVWSEKLITTVVDAAIKNNVYVIIDWHCHHLQLDAAKVFFRKMATKYGKCPNVIYEIFNEPERQSWPEVKSYSEEVIKVIRSIDPDNVILVGNPHWDQDLDVVADNPIVGHTNIMYSLHFYANTHRQELRAKGDYALSKGIPLFVSECASMEASGDGPVDYTEWQKWIDWMEKNRLSWVIWSISDKNETCSMLSPRAKTEGNWDDKVLRETGKLTRATVRKYNGIQ